MLINNFCNKMKTRNFLFCFKFNLFVISYFIYLFYLMIIFEEEKEH